VRERAGKREKNWLVGGRGEERRIGKGEEERRQ
jgi:hypothetical protein